MQALNAPGPGISSGLRTGAALRQIFCGNLHVHVLQKTMHLDRNLGSKILRIPAPHHHFMMQLHARSLLCITGLLRLIRQHQQDGPLIDARN